MRPSLQGFRRNVAGVVAVEFALLTPFLMVLLLGMFEVVSLVRVNLKLSHTANELSKIVAQQTAVTKGAYGASGTLGDYCKGAAYTLAPFANGSLSAQLISVTSSKGGTPTMDWEADNACPTAALAYGSTAADNMASNYGLTPNAGDSAILVRVSYTYTPLLHYVLGSSWTLNQTSFARPRGAASIPCTGC